MSLQSAVTRLYKSLEVAGFDFAAPDPGLAWQVFKDFARLAPEGEHVRGGYVEFECVHYADRDAVLHLGFERWLDFIGTDSDDVVGSVAVGCELSCAVPKQLVGVHRVLASGQFGSLDAFFVAVESLPEFGHCLGLHHWNWETVNWGWDKPDQEADDEHGD